MIDTAKLTAAVETLQGYCEQVRLVMVARGYPLSKVYIAIRAGDPSLFTQSGLGVVDEDSSRNTPWEHFHPTDFTEALAYAEARPVRATPDDFAATIGITPDGRVLDAVEG